MMPARTLPLLRRLLGSASAERGSASIQMVMLLPALFTLMFLGVQAALLYQGRALAVAAAQEGARAAASEHGTASDGVGAARDFLDQSTAGLRHTNVTAQRSPTQVTVTVSTQALSVLPGWTPRITQSASLPVERVTG